MESSFALGMQFPSRGGVESNGLTVRRVSVGFRPGILKVCERADIGEIPLHNYALQRG